MVSDGQRLLLLLLLHQNSLSSQLALKKGRILRTQASSRGHDYRRLGGREPDLPTLVMEKEVLKAKIGVQEGSGLLLLLLLGRGKTPLTGEGWT